MNEQTTTHTIHGQPSFAVFRKRHAGGFTFLRLHIGDNLTVDVYGDPDATADALRYALELAEVGA